jgi:hypothetical protein
MAGTTQLIFSIDQHPLYVSAVGGGYIEPLHVDAITIPIGTRCSVMVRLDQPASGYTVRAANSGANQVINGTGVMTYKTSTQSQKTSSQPWVTEVSTNPTANTVFLNEKSVVHFPAEAPSLHVDQTHILKVEHAGASTSGNWVIPASQSLTRRQLPLLFNQS